MPKRRKNPDSMLPLLLVGGAALLYLFTRKKTEQPTLGDGAGNLVTDQPPQPPTDQPPVVAPPQPYQPPPPPPPRKIDQTAVARQKALNWLRDKVSALSRQAGEPISLYDRLAEDGAFGPRSQSAARTAILTIASALKEGERSGNRGLRVATNASFFGDPFRYGAGDRALANPVSGDGLKALDTLRVITQSEVTPLDAYLLHMGGRAALGLPVKQFDIDIFGRA